jgi:hypothetical protein
VDVTPAAAPSPLPLPTPLVPPAAPTVIAVPAPRREVRSAAAEPPVPIAHVTIGRLEVRAAPVPPPAPEERPPPKHRAISLEEYLDGRRRPRR